MTLPYRGSHRGDRGATCAAAHSRRGAIAVKINKRPGNRVSRLTLRDLKFPWLYVLEVLLLVPLMGAFVGVISFLAARPVGSLDLKGRALPAGWTAAYPNHGRYLRGYLIADHRLGFAALLFL